jgi:hypothetical protein
MTAGQKVLLKSTLDQTIVDLSIQATQFKLHDQLYTLLSFQDIRYELEAHEVESWQKLIRVLTHEIINSVIPIATLISIVNEMLMDETGKLVDLTNH